MKKIFFSKPLPLLFLVALVLNGFSIQGQGTAGYEDERGQFYAWENGNSKMLESVGALEWKAAPDYLVYLDNTGELVYYQGGSKRDLGVIRP